MGTFPSCSLPVTLPNPADTAHSPLCLVFSGLFLLSLKSNTTRSGVAEDVLLGSRQRQILGQSGMPSFSGPQREHWLAILEVIPGDKFSRDADLPTGT